VLDPHFVIVGVLASMYGTSRYIIDTIRGDTRPNRVSWFLWGAAPLIVAAGEVEEGVGIAFLSTFWVGCGPLLIFASSFVNKNAYWKITTFDWFCAVVSVLAIAGLLVLRTGDTAILLGIIADVFASIPVLIKSWCAPESETSITYLIAAVSSVIRLLTVDTLTFANVAFPIYIFLLSLLLVYFIEFRKPSRAGVTAAA
jgi:hypothetical protein